MRSDTSGVVACACLTEAKISRYEYSPIRIEEAAFFLLRFKGSAKAEPFAYFPILVSSVSLMVGCGRLILELNCKSCMLFLPLVCSIALGRFFYLSLLRRFRSKARFRRSSSSLNLASICLRAVLDLSTSISGVSAAPIMCLPSGTVAMNGTSLL